MIITTYFPIQYITQLNTRNDIINYVRNVFPPLSNALPATGILTQGDAGQRSDIARNKFGVSGLGVKVGVLSDSYNVLGGEAGDILTGDLPTDVQTTSGSRWLWR